MRRLGFVSHIPVQAVSAVPCQVLRAILISLASCEFLAFSIFSTSFYKIERSVKSGGAYLCPAIVLIDSAFPKMLNLWAFRVLDFTTIFPVCFTKPLNQIFCQVRNCISLGLKLLCCKRYRGCTRFSIARASRSSGCVSRYSRRSSITKLTFCISNSLSLHFCSSGLVNASR